MSDDGQMIYHYHARVAWKKKRCNGYINNYKDMEFLSRAESMEHMNKDVGFLMQLMVHNGLTGSSIVDVRVIEIYDRKEISKSFYYKQEQEQ